MDNRIKQSKIWKGVIANRILYYLGMIKFEIVEIPNGRIVNVEDGKYTFKSTNYILVKNRRFHPLTLILQTLYFMCEFSKYTSNSLMNYFKFMNLDFTIFKYMYKCGTIKKIRLEE